MLVSTGDVRTWLGVATADTGPNAKIETLINAVEDFADHWTNRALEATYYNEHPDFSYLDGNGQRYIYLPQYPISWIGTVNVDADREWNSATAVGSADLVIYWKQGKLWNEEGIFSKGHRNVRVDYIAGYGDTGSSYPIPKDLKQTIIEMVVDSFKEGITAVHTIEAGENIKFMQMLSGNSFWRNTLDEYKNHAAGLAGFWE